MQRRRTEDLFPAGEKSHRARRGEELVATAARRLASFRDRSVPQRGQRMHLACDRPTEGHARLIRRGFRHLRQGCSDKAGWRLWVALEKAGRVKKTLLDVHRSGVRCLFSGAWP